MPFCASQEHKILDIIVHGDTSANPRTDIQNPGHKAK